MKLPFVLLATIPLFATVEAQWLNHRTLGIPRTADGKPNLSAPGPRGPDGKPDLSGLWTRISPTYRGNIAADLKPGEVQPWAEALVAERTENLGKDSMRTRCLPLGPAYSTTGGAAGIAMMKIVQTPTLIIILNEDLTYRQIFLDGRALESDPNPSWMGYSVGRWEGDTLVVESNGFNDRTWLDSIGHPHTEALRMTERYKRRDLGNLDVEVTLEDRAAFARPWTVAVRAELAPDTELLEYVCNENNQSLTRLVGTASDGRIRLAAEILAQHAGTYEEQPPYWNGRAPRTIRITTSGNSLFGEVDGRGLTELVAQSETAFVGLPGVGGGVEFVKDDRGVTTGLVARHLTDNYRFLRTR